MATEDPAKEIEPIRKGEPVLQAAPPMPSIILDLPVTSISDSLAFFLALGFTTLQQADESARAATQAAPEDAALQARVLLWQKGPSVTYLTLHPLEHFERFGGNAGKDAWREKLGLPATSVAQIVGLPCMSRSSVDGCCVAATKSGGKLDPIPVPDFSGAIYKRYIEDPDGRVWALYWSRKVGEAWAPESCMVQ